MGLQNLFKLIREENVAVWVGAGFSFYAGYPSGVQLQKVIYNELTDDEKRQLDPNSSLRNTAGALVSFRNNSRKELNTLLKGQFNKKPSSTYNHDVLSRIPHFHEIITTNYDSLIEDSFTKRAHVIRSDEDIAYLKSTTTAIYKPHGDLQSYDKIIITDNDYAKFLHGINASTPFWNSIKDILAKKTILFLGYSFEDENVWSWMDLIDQAVGNSRNQRYLIAPNWNELKVKKLIFRNVEYINLAADSFLIELDQELKQKMIPDLENGIVSRDTFNNYFSLRDYDSQIQTKDGKPFFAGLYKEGRPLIQQVNLAFADKQAAKKFIDFNKGYGKSIELDIAHLKEFNSSIEGFNLNMNKENIKSLRLIRQTKTRKIDLEFPEDDLLLEEITFEIYQSSKTETKIEIDYFGFKILLTLMYSKKDDGIEVGIQLDIPNEFPSLTKCISFFKAMILYAAEKKAVFYIDGETINRVGQNFKGDILRFENTLQFFENLRLIEKAFNVKFKNKEIVSNDITYKAVAKMARLINDKCLKVKLKDGIRIRRNPKLKDNKFEDLPNTVTSLLVESEEIEIVELLGQKLNLGRGALHIDKFEMIDYNDDRTEATVISKTGEYVQLYDKITPLDSLL